ncbi:MAG TPA: CDGSH iron-sulfur domain-containing protein [Mycobacteriales bacterium]|nr:CDGSH iron-sulfur domain-containing protein [Mycobacteriales bacterium]
MEQDEVTITAYEDGPLLVRGPVTFRTQDGDVIDAGRATVALCRCGKSASKPFCDGTHKVARFRAASRPDQRRVS